MPDFIRVLDDFPVTRTHKILIRPLKQQHYNIEKYPDMQIYFRQRGDDTLPFSDTGRFCRHQGGVQEDRQSASSGTQLAMNIPNCNFLNVDKYYLSY